MVDYTQLLQGKLSSMTVTGEIEARQSSCHLVISTPITNPDGSPGAFRPGGAAQELITIDGTPMKIDLWDSSTKSFHTAFKGFVNLPKQTPTTVEIFGTAVHSRGVINSYNDKTFNGTDIEILQQIFSFCDIPLIISDELSPIQVRGLRQNNETNLKFATRLARKYDRQLIFVGGATGIESKNPPNLPLQQFAFGHNQPSKTIWNFDLAPGGFAYYGENGSSTNPIVGNLQYLTHQMSFSLQERRRELPDAVAGIWRDRGARVFPVFICKFNKGNRVHFVELDASSTAEAQIRMQAVARRVTQYIDFGTIALPAAGRFIPGNRVQVSGIPGWSAPKTLYVPTVEHEISGEDGYTTTLTVGTPGFSQKGTIANPIIVLSATTLGQPWQLQVFKALGYPQGGVGV